MKAKKALGPGGDRAVAELRKTLAGLRESVTYSAGLVHASPEVLERAHINEFGLGVPERPFFRIALRIIGRKLTFGASARFKRFVFSGSGVSGFTKASAEFAAATLRKTITSNVPPPNAKSTVERKGSDKTLIETGEMLDSVGIKKQ